MKTIKAGVVLLFAFNSATGEAGEPAKKKLEIYILVGQSNMVSLVGARIIRNDR